MKLNSNYYPASQGDAAFIEIPADSVQTWHQCNFAIFGGSLTLIMDNRKELKKELFQKVASELGT